MTLDIVYGHMNVEYTLLGTLAQIAKTMLMGHSRRDRVENTDFKSTAFFLLRLLGKYRENSMSSTIET